MYSIFDNERGMRVVIRLSDNASIPFDPDNRHYQEYLAWVAAGNIAPPWSSPVPGVPASVTPLQARRALNESGRRVAVEEWIAAQTQDIIDAWEYATTIERHNPILAGASEALNMTEEQMDQLFILAASKD